MITLKKILISRCITGVYLRWWFNGWHYFCFNNDYEIKMKTESLGTQVTRFFSVVSKIERPTKIKTEYSYSIVLQGISSANIKGFQGLLLAEKVEQYEKGIWREVKITRKENIIKENGAPAYSLSFEITRKEIVNGSTLQKEQHLYVNEVECDLDENEVIAITKQVNDIAEMQDRQADYTAEFKIRKTRAMRDLFELTGEIGANTDIPFTKLPCRYVCNGIEIVPLGYLVISKSDYNYYYASIYSGNLNFFNKLEDLTLNDLILSSCNHTWNASVQASTNKSELNYVYPLIEPSDDAKMNSTNITRTEIYGGWIWPFVKCKAIFDEIILNAGFTTEGDILTDPTFLKMFMPISEREASITLIAKYKYALTNSATYKFTASLTALPGGNTIVGDYDFRYFGYYITRFAATYKISISIIQSIYEGEPNIYLRDETVSPIDHQMTMGADQRAGGYRIVHTYDIEYAAESGVLLKFMISPCTTYIYTIHIYDISSPKIGYLTVFNSENPISNYLPDLSQTDFIKMICNFFGLIPEVNNRTRKILFWNYSLLYDNISKARDWSAYLSETDDEVEFKFGEYCRNNYMRFNDSDDVVADTGLGNMTVDDETLDKKQDVIEIPVATSDQVKVLGDVIISRIAFNKYNSDDAVYEPEDSIDPRIVIVEQVLEQLTSPVYQKTFGIRDTISGGIAYDVTSPYKARAMKFSDTILNYMSLSRMLTKTNIRKVKLNLPVYEVAGLKHYIPVYFSQFKAYFYVNSISDYVNGQLCTVELIKL